MRQFSVSIDINAPAERVWEVMFDINRWHEWTPSIVDIKRINGDSLEVGSQVVIRQPKFPPALWQVTVLEPGASFTWVSKATGLRVYGSHSVDRTATGSRATLAINIQGVFGGLWGRLTRGITERYLGLEAKGLKARSENPQFLLEQQVGCNELANCAG